MSHQEESYPGYYLYHRIVRAKLFVDQHFSDKIDLDQIANEAMFSRFHFIRIFRSVYQLTPHQYLIRVRIENAKLCLQNNLSVADTCYEVGFESVTSFSSLFKNIEGLSPSIYQQRHQARIRRIKDEPLAFVPACFAKQNGWIEK